MVLLVSSACCEGSQSESLCRHAADAETGCDTRHGTGVVGWLVPVARGHACALHKKVYAFDDSCVRGVLIAKSNQTCQH
eukprot:6652070-Prymnesium_polylepis.1